MNINKLNILPIKAFKDNYIWVLGEHDMAEVILIDPGDAAPVIAALDKHKIRVVAILLTHHHWDHSGGIGAIQQHYGEIPVYAGRLSQIEQVTHHVDGKFSIKLKNRQLDFEVRNIPGHTLDHVAFYTEGNLFTGDTLFSAGCGRVFEGTHQQLFKSLNDLCQFPDETRIYCGHEYTLQNLAFAKVVEPGNKKIFELTKTIEEMIKSGRASLPSILATEKAINPFLRCHVKEVRNSVIEKFNAKPDSTNAEIFYWLRTWKNDF